MINSKSVRILNFIAENDGVPYSEIQRQLCKMSGLDYDKKVPTTVWRKIPGKFNPVSGFQEYTRVPAMHKPLRGYWCTNLTGGMMYHKGLLNFYCTKGNDGLWRRNSIPHNDKPWKQINHNYHNP